MSGKDDSHLTWVSQHPFATQLPVTSAPEEGKQWIIEFPFGELWYYWPWRSNLPDYLVAHTFETCLSMINERKNASLLSRVFPPVPLSRWRIRNVENDKEVMYVGLII